MNVGTSKVVQALNFFEMRALVVSTTKETNSRLHALGLPILPMQAALDDGAGSMKEGFSYDISHPNGATMHSSEAFSCLLRRSSHLSRSKLSDAP